MPDKPTYEELEKKVHQLKQALSEKQSDTDSLVLKTIPDIMFRISQDGVHLDYHCPSLDQLFIQPNEFLGHNVRDVLPADVAEQYIFHIRKAIGENEVQSFFYELEFAPQDRRHYEARMNAIDEEAVLVIVREITDRIQAETDLRRQQRMLARTEKITHVGSWEWDIEADTVIWSEELYNIFQLDPKAAAPNWAEHSRLYHPKDFETLSRAVDAAVNDGTPYQVELRAIRKDGETRICQASGFAEMGSNGKPVRLVGSLQDVTRSKESENELQKRQAELQERNRFIQTILDNLPIGLAVNYFDSGTATYMNKQFEKIYGWPQEELKNIPEFFEKVYPDPAYRQEIQTRVLADIESGDPKRMQWDNIQATAKDGSRRIISAKNIPLFDQNFMISIVQDVTERQQAEDALIESEEKYRLLVEKADEAIFIAQDEVIKFPNPKTLAITGYTEDELAKMPFVSLIHPEDRQMVFERYRQRLDGQHPPSNYAFRIINKAGSELWLQINVAPTTWEGRPATINLIRDITEQRALEDQVRQAHKMESIGTLAGGIAHEFNNMLGIILGNSELALNDIPAWNPAVDFVREIRTASLRAKDVVGKLLSVAHKSPESRKPVQIRTVVDESLGLLRKTIPASIDIRSNITCTRETVLADPTEIGQLLMNLCTNAVHAMSGEEGVLQVSIEAVTLDSSAAARWGAIPPGGYARLNVTDDGSGIGKEIIDRVFDPYFTTKEVGQGLGMGLAIVHGIVRKHDGAIKIASQPGKGTTVSLLLPLIDEEPDSNSDITETPTAGSERILFVDDEPSLVTMASQMLQLSGYDVVGKTKSTAALKVFRDNPDRFDLVITDMAMPEMSGDRLAREIIRTRADVPIILCTGHSDRMDENKAKRMGIKGFAMKPLTMTVLTQTVRKVLDAAKGIDY